MSTAAMGSRSFSQVEGEGSAARRAASWLLVALGVGGAVVLVLWLLGWIRLYSDPRVVEIQRLQKEARETFATDGGPRTLDEAKAAVASMQQIRERIDALPASLRRQAEAQGGSVFRSAMQARINAYFALPPQQRQAELDRQIKQEELFRQAWQQQAAARAAAPGGGGQSGAADAGQAAAGGQGGTAAGPQAGGGTGGPGFGPPRGGSEEDRNRWRKNIIDTTTPEQRARYVEYRRAMDARRGQLGLPATGPR